jgi:hypothetical protein
LEWYSEPGYDVVEEKTRCCVSGVVASTIIDDLIDEGCWEVVFGTCIVEIAKVGANADRSLFFVDGYRVGNP